MWSWCKETIQDIWSWLKGAFKAVIDTLGNLLQKVIDGLYAIAGWLWDIIVYCGQVLWDFFFHEEDGLLWTVCGWVAEWGEWFVEQFPDVVQYIEPFHDSASQTMTLIGKLNTFFPIVETIIFIGVFIVYVMLYIGVKFILKLVPTIG